MTAATVVPLVVLGTGQAPMRAPSNTVLGLRRCPIAPVTATDMARQADMVVEVTVADHHLPGHLAHHHAQSTETTLHKTCQNATTNGPPQFKLAGLPSTLSTTTTMGLLPTLKYQPQSKTLHIPVLKSTLAAAAMADATGIVINKATPSVATGVVECVGAGEDHAVPGVLAQCHGVLLLLTTITPITLTATAPTAQGHHHHQVPAALSHLSRRCLAWMQQPSTQSA